MQLGAALRRKHIDSFRILDVAADFGGTWYWNRYPGLRCDVESYIYLPFLEETGYMPSERYVRGCEILAYCQRLGRHFSLYERALFQTGVTGMRWDDEAARWWVSTDRGDTFRARFVTTQSGIFSRPQLPGIEGLESFQGKMFHSARWDYDYTGGDTFGGLAHLADKRVGLLGTGTTALQVVPEVAKCARHLTVFQRTPTAVGVRDNPTDSQWFAALPPGWQRQREITFNQLANGERADCPVDDGWARFFNRLIDAVETLPADQRTPEAIGLAQEQADYVYNDIVRARVDEYVQDAPNRRAIEGLLPHPVQTPRLQRRLPAGIQPAQREPGRCQPRHRTSHRERHADQRQAIRARLPDFLHRLRARDFLDPPGRLRCAGPRRPPPLGKMGQGSRHLARAVQRRLPEPVLHGSHANRHHHQRAAHAARAD
ncbi:MAG: NAD(P)/FAD-dependent oxidoreductase [Proteobacteria bacterium]|nr:NAD(P)/FAD-dependent oxidoreductase [Pseudomonadota bacterium]